MLEHHPGHNPLEGYARGEADRRKRTFGSFLGEETGVGRLGRRPARTAGLSGDEASGSWPRRL